MSIHPRSMIQMEMGLINPVMLQQLIISQVIKVQTRLASTREMAPDKSQSGAEKKENIEANMWSKLSVYCRHKTTKTLWLFASLAQHPSSPSS